MTLGDLMPLILEERPFELIDGEIVEKAAPTPAHGMAQAKSSACLDAFNRKPGGPRGPGGWWIMSEVDIRYPKTDEVFRHDVCGYRRERCPARPAGFPVEAQPDWAMEILSKSNARYDTVKKQRTLHARRGRALLAARSGSTNIDGAASPAGGVPRRARCADGRGRARGAIRRRRARDRRTARRHVIPTAESVSARTRARSSGRRARRCRRSRPTRRARSRRTRTSFRERSRWIHVAARATLRRRIRSALRSRA